MLILRLRLSLSMIVIAAVVVDALDDGPEYLRRSGGGVVLEAVDVARGHLEGVSLAQQHALGDLGVPLGPARVREGELQRVVLALPHEVHLRAEAHGLLVLDAARGQLQHARDPLRQHAACAGARPLVHVEALRCGRGHIFAFAAMT